MCYYMTADNCGDFGGVGFGFFGERDSPTDKGSEIELESENMQYDLHMTSASKMDAGIGG